MRLLLVYDGSSSGKVALNLSLKIPPRAFPGTLGSPGAFTCDSGVCFIVLVRVVLCSACLYVK